MLVYLLMFVICIFMASIIINFINGLYIKKSFIYKLIMSNNIFVLQYIACACPYIIMGNYSVEINLISVIICELIIISLFIIKKKKIYHIYMHISENDIFYIVCSLIVFLLIRISSEEISSFGDMGAYFQHTILMMKGNYGSRFVLEEIGTISETVDTSLKTMFYGTFVSLKDNIYQMHGLGTWCIFPALFGKIFGISKYMLGVNYLFILSFFNFLYGAENFIVHKRNKYMVPVLFGLSPLMLYIGKTNLSEVAVLFLLSVVICSIFCENVYSSLIVGIALGEISLVHVNGIMYIPIAMFVLFIAGVKLKKKRKCFFRINLIQGGIYIISQWYAYLVSPSYTGRQYAVISSRLGGGTFTTFFVIDFIIILFLLMNHMVYQDRLKICNEIFKFYFRNYRFIYIGIIILIVCVTLYYGYFLAFTDKFALDEIAYADSTWKIRNTYINTGISAISYLNMTNIIRATGILGGIIFLVVPFVKKQMSFVSQIFYLASLLVMVLFTIYKWDTPINYYASRYIAPVLVPLIILTLVATIENRSVIIILISCAFIFNKQYVPSMLLCATHVGQMEILEDTLEIIDSGAIVLIDTEKDIIASTLLSDLRILNNNYCYSLNDYNEVTEKYGSDMKIYIISKDNILNQFNNIDEIFNKEYISQYSLGHGEGGTYGKISTTYNINVNIYEVNL